MAMTAKKRNVIFGTVMSVGMSVLAILLLVAAVIGTVLLIAFMLRVLRSI